MHLKQKGNINDYTHEWEVLATRQCGFTDEQLLKIYICGLKDYICSEIKIWNHKTIEDAKHATKPIEQKTNSIRHHSQVQTGQINIQIKDQRNTLQTSLTSMYHLI